MALRLNGSTSGYVGIDAPVTAANNTLVLPNGNGSNGQALTTNGSGTLSWTSITGSQWTTSGSDIYYTTGKALVGTSTARTSLGPDIAPLQQVEGTSYTSSAISVINNQNTGNPSFLILGKSRGTAVGSNTVVQNGDAVGEIRFVAADGSNLQGRPGSISCEIDGAPGAGDLPGRLVFSTTAVGASSPTERFRLQANGVIGTGALYNRTTAAAANVYVDSGTDLYRSTSSIKYKTDVETLQDSYADAILNVRPVWYRSTCEGDCHDHSWWGFIAEEVAEIDPRLVHWKTKEITYDEKGCIVPEPCDPEPEGVAYERFVPHLLNLIKRQQQAIETLEAANASLEARLTALEVTP